MMLVGYTQYDRRRRTGDNSIVLTGGVASIDREGGGLKDCTEAPKGCTVSVKNSQ